VVETDVHYPTDINLLFDAMRKVITLVARVCEELGLTGWRQSKQNLKKLKKLYRHAQQLKRTGAGTAERAQEKRRKIREAHREYTDEAGRYVEKAQTTISLVSGIMNMKSLAIVCEIENYLHHAERQIDQIRRRVLDGQTIPHEEKIFSIFQPHTEWISKGKAGVPQELGLRVCIVEDQYGFMLNHLVMKKSGDEKVAVPLLERTKREYPTLISCSFDKNFYSSENKKRLSAMLETVALPKKGKLTGEQRIEESQDAFVAARQQHPAVESGIHALENHGLDRCPDSGLRGFERYVALAVLGRNIQILGTILWKKEEQQRKRKAHARQAA
jgi:transposase, IS5 family